MKTSRKHLLVLITAPESRTARRLARAALKARLAACVNLVPAIESHYWWQGKLEKARETLLLVKTTRARLPALERLVLREHPYDTPEIISLPLSAGTRRYLDWWSESVDLRPPRKRASSG